MFLSRTNAILLLILLGAVGDRHFLSAEETSDIKNHFEVLQQAFQETHRFELQKYCLECHNSNEKQGDLDLEQFQSVAEIRTDITVWQRVLEMLTSEEMPPQEAKAPLAIETRRPFVAWLTDLVETEARSLAGDPGPVVLRRLNNAELDYTIQDLTGLSLQPARDFPADSAAGEGFCNVGNSLVVSASLVQKYLDAAKEVANHAVLLRDGIEFSPATTQRDWTNEKLAAIRTFYAKYSDATGSTSVNLQGLAFDTNGGGRLPLEKYLRATILERTALQAGSQSLKNVARTYKLNEQYLQTLWTFLNNKHDSNFARHLLTSWQSAGPEDVPALLQAISEWQKSLWFFATVGHIGKRDGPKAWQIAVQPLATGQEFRVPVPEGAAGSRVKLFLVTSDAGDGPDQDFVTWENPRFVAVDRPDLPLRDVPKATITEISGMPAVAPGSGQPVGQNEVIPAALRLEVHAPSILEVSLPFDAVAGYEFVVTGLLQPEKGAEGTVQLQVLTQRPDPIPGLLASAATITTQRSQWSDGDSPVTYANPIIASANSHARTRLLTEFAEFRNVFPAALCYTQIVPVDEAVTLTLFYREDEQLQRLMLDDNEKARLAELWDDFHFVSQDALALVDAYEQLWQFATQDADPSAFTPMRDGILQHAEEFRQQLSRSEPIHVQRVLEFAQRAWRRPLVEHESDQLSSLYRSLRSQDLTHDAAIRLLLARVLIAPAFLYRGEHAAADADAAPVNNWEMATRLSYFLWSSPPDVELRGLADAGRLLEPDILVAQMQRMLSDAKIRRMAIEFGCQWLQVRDFDLLNEKSSQHFPEFAALQSDMYEEAIRFWEEILRQDRSVLDLLDADYAIVNGRLAQFYGMSEIQGDEWRRVEGAKQYARGGILTLAATLSRHSGASRTSPILRGNWVSEFLLGEKLPSPPKGVPVLPEMAPPDLTERQLVERHSRDPACTKCHQRIDGFGFAMEQFDTIGRFRSRDTSGHEIVADAVLPDGTAVKGANGLREYLLHQRREDFIRRFCRSLLGYALGRSVQLSDSSLIREMAQQLAAHEFRISSAIETIVRSPQFCQVRGAAMSSSSLSENSSK